MYAQSPEQIGVSIIKSNFLLNLYVMQDESHEIIKYDSYD